MIVRITHRLEADATYFFTGAETPYANFRINRVGIKPIFKCF